MSSLPAVANLGTVSVREVESVLNSVDNSVSTAEVRSLSGLTLTCKDDLALSSTAGNVVITSSAPVRFESDVVVEGVVSDLATDSLKVGSKTINLNKRSDASDVNASGSGILVCGTDYASYESSNGAQGSKTSISILWTNTGNTEQWVLKGGDLSFSKVLSNGDVCTFTFASLDSGDLVLKRTIGSQTSQMLAYWETL